jgi:ribose-phosphate pyrophosphokinase
MSVLLARTINEVCGVKRVILLEPHDAHIKHYFKPQAQEVSTVYLLAAYLERNHLQSEELCRKSKIVYPDAGAAKRYGNIAHLLNLGTAYIDKDRPDNNENPQINDIVGDVKGFTCFMVDDECLTAKTTIGDAKNLIDHGATEVIMVVTHPILNDKDLPSNGVIMKLDESLIGKVIFTNSIPVAHKIAGKPKFVAIPVDALVAESVKRIILKQSISELHNMESVKKLDLL